MMISRDLDKAVAAVEGEDAMTLREISKRMSMLAVTEQEKDVIQLAVITYALNKLYSKAHYREKVREIKGGLLSHLRARDFDAAVNIIEKFDGEYGFFHGNLIGKARIKVGSRLYANGLSLSTAADLSGATAGDLQDYVGGTKTDYPSKTMTVGDRIQVAKKVFEQ